MKNQVLHYGSDMFSKSHFLIEDDSNVPSGIHRRYSFTGYSNGLNVGGRGRQLALSMLVFSIAQREDARRVLTGSVQGAIPVEHQIEGL